MQRIIRHTIPNKYDTAPFGTLCQSMNDDNTYKLFIQISKTDEAHWITIGSALELAFYSNIEDEKFLQEILHLIDEPQKNYKKLINLLL